mgnify:CR=1 FL=1
MNHVCILLHGIKCNPADRLWNEEVEARYQRITPIQLIARKYGYVPGESVWFSAHARRTVVDNAEAYFRGVYGERAGLLEDIEPGTLVSIAGHSLGGYITTALLKRGIKFHRIAHLWGSTISDFDWHKVDGNFDKARVYWSPNDEILTASAVAVGEDPELALGLMGKEGPSVAHPRVESIKTDWTHTQFMNLTPERDKFWADLFGWMAG